MHMFGDIICLAGNICTYLSDDELVQVETRRNDISDKGLYITDCTICWIKHCTSKLWHSLRIT